MDEKEGWGRVGNRTERNEGIECEGKGMGEKGIERKEQ